MINVAVLYNDDGDRLERGSSTDLIAWNGSMRAARAVSASLARSGFAAREIACGCDIGSLIERIERPRPGLVFNLCESFAGESRLESGVASLLEMLRIPFSGNDPLALAIAHDKARAKELLRSCGLPVAEWRVYSPIKPLPDLTGLTPPLIVKPRCEDGSHGISGSSVCGTCGEAMARAAEIAAEWRGDCLIEEFLPGREFNVGIVGGAVLPIAEIDYQLPAGLPNLVTYEAKWVEDSTWCRGTPVRCPATNVSAALTERLHALALGAWNALGCRDYARIDLRLDAAGEPHILEVNPNPDLSPDAGVARAAQEGGLDYDELVARIAHSAIARG